MKKKFHAPENPPPMWGAKLCHALESVLLDSEMQGLSKTAGPDLPNVYLFLVRALPAGRYDDHVLDYIIYRRWPDGVKSIQHLLEIIEAAREMMKQGNVAGYDQSIIRLPGLPDDVKEFASLTVDAWTLGLRARFNHEMGLYILASQHMMHPDTVMVAWRTMFKNSNWSPDNGPFACSDFRIMRVSR